MAELYADQGLFEDALGVYRKLAEARPADERIAARIEELEQQLEEDRASHSAGFELAELLELTEPRYPAEDEEPLGEAEPPTFEPEPFAEDVAPPIAEPAAASPEVVPAFEIPEPPGPSEPPAPVAEAGDRPDFGQPAEGEFEFQDEAPTAGIEHLDPFASSFDAMVKRDGHAVPFSIDQDDDEREPAAPPPPSVAPEVAEAVAPAADEPPDFLAIEPLVPASEDSLELLAAEPDLLPPGADVPLPPEFAEPPAPEPPAPAEPAAATPELPAVPAPTAAAASQEGAVPTIEDYLAGLLSFDPEAPRAEPTVAAPEAATEPTTEAEQAPEEVDPAAAEDLEQFQEWLRSLKR
jgi:hypothetical protein